MNKTRFPALLTALFLALAVFFIPVNAEPEKDVPESGAATTPDVPSSKVPEAPTVERCRSAYLYCFENDRALFEFKADDKVYPTSTAKLMTALVAAEHFASRLDTQITVSAEMLSTVVGNKLTPALSDGEVVTVEQMLYGTLVGGANDAACVLAYATAGSLSDFVTKMNDKAASSAVGARSTRYANPTGMHDDTMVTTARDTAKIALCVMQNDVLAQIVQTPKYVMEKTNKSDFRNIYNRNAMISKYYSAGYYDERAIGANAGGTAVGGYCAVEVLRDKTSGVTYLAVVMGADEEEESGKLYSYENAAALMKWAFDSYNYVSVLSEDKVVHEIGVTLSSTVDHVTLRPAKTVTVFLPASVDVEKDISLHCTTLLESLAAPVKEGEAVGTVTVTYGDEILGTANLVTTGAVDRSEFLYVLSQIEEFTGSKFFIVTIITAVVLTLVYVFGQAFVRGKRSKRL